jgi:N-acetylmuramoyl-L-alanine amidase
MKLPAALLSLFVFMLILPTMVWGAEAPIKLYMNEKLLNPEVAPRLVKDNTLVPVRIVAEELGAKVKWNQDKRQVTLDKGDLSILLTIDKRDILVRGKTQTVEVAPIMIEGNTLLPLRVIGEQMGVQFNWDGLTNSVHMFKKETSSPDVMPVSENPPLTDEQPAVDPVSGSTEQGNVQGPAVPVPVTDGHGKVEQPTVTTPIVPVNQTVNLVQSIETNGTDLIVKTKEGAVKPTMIKLQNPDRIVFDLPNTALDENLTKKLIATSGELPSVHPLIQKIRYSNYNNAPPTVRIILDLKEKADYQILPSTVPGVLSATIKQHKLKVVIDAGHGAKDPGAISLTGKKEKDFNLLMAKKVVGILSQDKRLEVLMTRSDDTFVELDDRVTFANDSQVDLFLSIHGNKYGPKITGTETYYYRPESLDFAKMIHKHAVASTGFPDRGVRQADYRVINKTTMPAVLVEVGYLSNASDEAAMFKDAFQNQVAASLAAAIKEYLNLK